MNQQFTENAAGHRESRLANVAAIPLDQLYDDALDSPLSRSIRHVLEEAERSDETISGWSSYVD